MRWGNCQFPESGEPTRVVGQVAGGRTTVGVAVGLVAGGGAGRVVFCQCGVGGFKVGIPGGAVPCGVVPVESMTVEFAYGGGFDDSMVVVVVSGGGGGASVVVEG